MSILLVVNPGETVPDWLREAMKSGIVKSAGSGRASVFVVNRVVATDRVSSEPLSSPLREHGQAADLMIGRLDPSLLDYSIANDSEYGKVSSKDKGRNRNGGSSSQTSTVVALKYLPDMLTVEYEV